jgi:hypothetical protein
MGRHLLRARERKDEIVLGQSEPRKRHTMEDDSEDSLGEVMEIV